MGELLGTAAWAGKIYSGGWVDGGGHTFASVEPATGQQLAGRSAMRSDPGRRHPTTVERRCHVLPGGGDIGRAVAKVYAYARVDYPGAAQSLVFDTDGTTTVGGFVFDPGSVPPRPRLRLRSLAGPTRLFQSRARP
jgi:hypothetical protein